MQNKKRMENKLELAIHKRIREDNNQELSPSSKKFLHARNPNPQLRIDKTTKIIQQIHRSEHKKGKMDTVKQTDLAQLRFRDESPAVSIIEYDH